MTTATCAHENTLVCDTALRRRAEETAYSETEEATIFEALHRGDMEGIRRLLLRRPQLIHAIDRDGNTLLHHAAMKSSCTLSYLLLTRGANLEARNIRGMTPLHLAVLCGAETVANLLLARGADRSLLVLTLA